MIGKGWFGITYGPQIQIYYLIALWGFACVVAMYALAHTPLGRIANAVRDNPERAEFIGYNPQVVRFLMVVLAGFFAGVAGGLTALNYEIVTSESLHAYTSGLVIMMAFVGGVGYFFGPILGALLITVLQMAVSSLTAAWLFYFGLLFLVVVLYAPGGIAGILAGASCRRGEMTRCLAAFAPPLIARSMCPVPWKRRAKRSPIWNSMCCSTKTSAWSHSPISLPIRASRRCSAPRSAIRTRRASRRSTTSSRTISLKQRTPRRPQHSVARAPRFLRTPLPASAFQ